jgi:hypothetical protein
MFVPSYVGTYIGSLQNASTVGENAVFIGLALYMYQMHVFNQ